MKLVVDRKWKKEGYTIGKLFIDDVFFCNTLEDKDRGLTSTMPIEKIKVIKKAAVTAIPSGTYNIRMDIVSPKFLVMKEYSYIVAIQQQILKDVFL